MLSVIVVQPAPTFVASGQGGGVPPRRGKSFDVRCTKGIVLVILYQYFRFLIALPECVYSGSNTSWRVNPSGHFKHTVVGWGAKHTHYYCLYLVSHIHVLYAVLCCRVRREGRQCPPPTIVVTALAICLRGLLFTSPCPPLPEHT